MSQPQADNAATKPDKATVEKWLAAKQGKTDAQDSPGACVHAR